MTPFALKYQLEGKNHPFRRAEVRRLPRDRSGVYALWLPSGDLPECLYVGISTTCIRRRLLSHISNETNPELRRQLHMFRETVRFSHVLTDSDDQIRRLEALLVADWQPLCNVLLR